MKVFVLVFFILCFEFSIIESVNLKCQFGTVYWFVLGDVNRCRADNQGDIITERSNRQVNTINGSAIANPSVKAVSIYNSNCFYFPFGLEKLFPNLEGFLINHSKLKELRREDFKDYKNLRNLDLEANEIKYLEPNLFEFVPKLEGIFLSNNQIAHIDANVFNNFVSKLSHLYLNRNICKFENAENDRSKANEIIAKVQSGSCKDQTLLPTSVQFDSLTKLIENLQVSLMQEVNSLRGEVNGKLATLNDKFEASEVILKSQVQNFNEQNLEIKAELKEAKNKLEINQNEIKSEILKIKNQNLEIKAGLSNITAQIEKPETENVNDVFLHKIL